MVGDASPMSKFANPRHISHKTIGIKKISQSLRYLFMRAERLRGEEIIKICTQNYNRILFILNLKSISNSVWCDGLECVLVI